MKFKTENDRLLYIRTKLVKKMREEVRQKIDRFFDEALQREIKSMKKDTDGKIYGGADALMALVYANYSEIWQEEFDRFFEKLDLLLHMNTEELENYVIAQIEK